MPIFEPLLPVGVVWLNEAGAVDRPASVAAWRAHAVRVDGDELVWDGHSQSHSVTLERTTLDEFVRLADAPADRVRRYVEHWGPLGLCLAHRLPHALAESRSSTEAPCMPIMIGGPFREPIEGYRFFARQARAMIQITHQIRRRSLSGVDQKRPRLPSRRSNDPNVQYFPAAAHPHVKALAVPAKQWEPLRSLFTSPLDGVFEALTRPGSVASVEDEMRAIQHAITTWMVLGQVEVRWAWQVDRADPEISLGCSHLFGGLALALALQTTRMSHLHMCEDCGSPFTPARKKAVVRWCPACRPTGSKREQQRRYRARKRAEARSERR